METISITIITTAGFLFGILPGLIFLRNFWGRDKGRVQLGNIHSYLIWGVPVSVVLYCLVYLPIHFCPPLRDFFKVREVLETIYKKLEIPTLLDLALLLLFSIFIVDVIAGLLGHFLRKKILARQLDVKYKLLRFDNDLFYLLTGRFYFYKEEKKNNIKYEREVQATLTCWVGNQLVVYTGKVNGFMIKGDGSLEYIRLKGVTKRIGSKTPAAIKGHVMVIKAEEIKNMNITYLATPKVSQPKRRFRFPLVSVRIYFPRT